VLVELVQILYGNDELGLCCSLQKAKATNPTLGTTLLAIIPSFTPHTHTPSHDSLHPHHPSSFLFTKDRRSS
jgi:hypothetical protein